MKSLILSLVCKKCCKKNIIFTLGPEKAAKILSLLPRPSPMNQLQLVTNISLEDDWEQWD